MKIANNNYIEWKIYENKQRSVLSCWSWTIQDEYNKDGQT